MAVVDAMGVLDDGHRFVHEGLLGTTFTGSLVARTTVGDQPAIVVKIEGEAWITGEHKFVMHEDDPFGSGLTLASRSGR
jgi:proline racemase